MKNLTALKRKKKHLTREGNMAEKTTFEILSGINVNDKTEKKKTGSTELTYLSWAWAWGEFKKVFPKADYDIYRNEQGLPYVFDPNTGYMCYVTVDNGEGESHTMWLPVMDGANNAMLDRPYEIKTKYKTATVNRATMFDVNKTIMRCLVKCLAMFGLGLYIYAGEDLPEGDEEAEPKKKKAEPKEEKTVRMASPAQINQLKAIYKERFPMYLEVNGYVDENHIPMEEADSKIREVTEMIKKRGK